MPRATWTQNNFNGGEWSPLTYGRSDLDRYKNALATCLNYVPTTQGGLTRRPGTRFVAYTKQQQAVRLVSYEFSITQAYILEFGPGYIRFYTNEAQLLESTQTVSTIVGSTVTVAAHGYTTNDEVFIGNFSGGAWTSGRNYRITVVNPNTFTVVDTFGVAVTPAGNTVARVYEITTPYTANDLQDLAFVQSADVLYIAHKNWKPRKLSRNAATSWALNTISFRDGPYLNTNTSTTTLTPGATTGSTTITASSVSGINGGAGFSANDVGRPIRIRHSSTWGYAVITGFTSTTVVNVDVVSAFGAATASASWRLGAWYGVEGSSTTARYPGSVTFNQDRLVYASTWDLPSRVDASNTADYENFAPTQTDGTVVDSNALSFTLNSTKVNAVNWLISDEWGLLAGTASAEWVISASTTQNALTPTNVSAKVTTSYGGTNVPPVKIGKSTLFVQRTKRKLREMTYQFTLGTFSAPDISLIAEHLTKTGIKQMAAQLAPHPLVWLVRNDGALVGFCYDKEQEVLGWHQHQLGGFSNAGQTAAPVVESVAVIPAPSVDRDQVWVSVQRYINGYTTRTIELMQKFWEDGDTLPNSYFVDCGATYSGAATSNITGLNWLAGQTVSVLADGSVHPTCVVSASGTITLQRSASVVQVGLGYNSTGKTMRIEAGAADGPAQGKLKRIHRAIFRFFQSVGLNVQSTGGTAFPEPFRTSADRMDQPVALYTGDKRWSWDGSYELEGQVTWTQSDPLPSNVLMVAAQLETQDGG